MVKEQRLLDTFLELVKIDSLSLKEAGLLEHLKGKFGELGYSYKTDNASEVIGSNADNLVIYIKGNSPQAPTLMFSAHMDTVAPGEGIEPVIEGDKIYSKGETILGGDDKSGIAVMLEMARILKENDIPHGDIEFVFTISEEIGLKGASNLDRDLVSAKYGFVLDGESVYAATVKAPAAVRYTAVFHGKEAHAGVAPEKGINAIRLASRAVASLPDGRIDEETTANVGVFEGGRAANIVPSEAKVVGEARSHNMEKLAELKVKVVNILQGAVEGVSVEADGHLFEAKLDLDVEDSYPNMDVREDAFTVQLVKKVVEGWGKEFELKASGGGTDANLHNGAGIETIVLGTGMQAVHTVDEHIHLSSMVDCLKLCLGIIEGSVSTTAS